MILSPTLFERLLHKLHLLPTPILNTFGDVLFGRALAIAVRRGLFESMGAGPTTAETLCRDTGLSVRGVRLLVDSFVVAGYAKEEAGMYSLSKEGKTWLLKSSPYYVGNLIAYFETLYERWGYLEESLQHGKPPRLYFEDFQEEDWRIYVYGMRDLARMMIRHVGPKLNLDLEARSVLDVGGSHGLYSIFLATKYPHVHATVLDFPGALRHTAGILEDEQLSHRVSLHAGDFMKEDLPGKQDGVLLCNIIHGFPEEENKELIRRSLESLNPGGKIFVLDQFTESAQRSRLGRFIPLMVGLNLLNETGGTTYSIKQVKAWSVLATSVKHHRLRLPGVGLLEILR